MPTSRKLQCWRWSAHTLEVRPMDVAGELAAGSANEALELVARDQGCTGLLGFHYWHHGGHANARNSAGVEVHIVVVCFGPALATTSRKPKRDAAPRIEDGTPGPARLAARFAFGGKAGR